MTLFNNSLVHSLYPAGLYFFNCTVISKHAVNLMFHVGCLGVYGHTEAFILHQLLHLVEQEYITVG